MNLPAIDPALLPYLTYGLVALAAFLAGLLIQYLFSRATSARLEGEIALRDAAIRSDEERANEREAALTAAQNELKAVFGDLARESLEQNSQSFLRVAGLKFETDREKANAELNERRQAVESLVKPIKDALEKTNLQINEIEKTRVEAYGNLTAQLSAVHSGQESLRSETSKLVSSLRQPNVRGQWGELTLRRLAELAGMVDRCDFAEQVHVKTADGDPNSRPDMVVHLPENGQLVVDVKTPLEAYIKAIAETDEDKRKAFLEAHARSMNEHVKKLASKAYFDQFERSPEFVILFVPGDQFLSAALDVRPNLLEDALRNKVLLTTPTSLVALLKVVAYGWMQFKLAENAEVIRDLAVDMHKRVGVFTGHIESVGKKLNESVKSFNSAVASLETRVLPNMRKIKDLGADSGKDTPIPQTIDITARSIKLSVEETRSESGDMPADEDRTNL